MECAELVWGVQGAVLIGSMRSEWILSSSVICCVSSCTQYTFMPSRRASLRAGTMSESPVMSIMV